MSPMVLREAYRGVVRVTSQMARANNALLSLIGLGDSRLHQVP